jgi:hypothetical protein
MTVSELIELLKQHDQNAVVLLAKDFGDFEELKAPAIEATYYHRGGGGEPYLYRKQCDGKPAVVIG